ncbi:MAG: hypothetical protein V1932_06125 [Chloroflexota bacterium]
MNGEEWLHKDASFLLTSADKANGLSIVTDDGQQYCAVETWQGSRMVAEESAEIGHAVIGILSLIRSVDSGRTDK